MELKSMKASEIAALAKQHQAQASEGRRPEIIAGDHLAGDHFLRPDWQQRIQSGDGMMERLAIAHRALREGHLQLQAASKSRDPEQTEDAHFMSTKKLGDKWIENAGNRAVEVCKQTREVIENERKAIARDLQLVETHRSHEIRSHIRSLKPAERVKVVQDAIEAKDAETIASICEAPAYLTGLKPDQIETFRRQYEAKHAYERLRRIDALEHAARVTDMAVTEATVFANKMFPHKRVSEIEAKQKAAREMRAKLEPKF